MTHLLLAVIYIAFISLGLPDSILGAAWPTIYPQLHVPVSYAGIVSMIISLGTVFSSLQSDRLTRKFGTGKLTAISVAMTALALLGFSVSNSFLALCLWAIPYGLGAGSVDAGLNNYVALHYESRHMSWLHCFWGIGATLGPYIMGMVLTSGQVWHSGYRCVGVFQMALACLLVFSLPLWKHRKSELSHCDKKVDKALSLGDVFRLKGSKNALVCHFCYCAAEHTVGLWASSYLVLCKNVPEETAAHFASMFYIGITAGRALSGFLTMRFSNTQMIRLGQGIIAVGIAAMFLPFGTAASLPGLVLVGLGCAPIYPCLIHSTPVYFGEENSQAMIGVQMACAFCGTSLMPPLFGLIAEHISVALFPAYILLILLLMIVMHECLLKKQQGK